MEGYDLEIGPIQRTFDELFKRINEYFNSAQVAPDGPIKEEDLSTYSQKKLRQSLNENLEYFGFDKLPFAMRIISGSDSKISGFKRSDHIVVYDEKLPDGSHRIFNFYHDSGPENMEVSFYWLNIQNNVEELNGILTDDKRWYVRITTNEKLVYYLRMEKKEESKS